MKPVKQIKVDKINGDCERACIASSLELPISKVPNFMECPELSHFAMVGFLKIYGYSFIGICADKNKILTYKGVDGYFIAVVNSINFENTTHTVIFKGNEFVFDPSPNKSKVWQIEDVKYFYIIEKDQKEDI
jgi:hypothetical protein